MKTVWKRKAIVGAAVVVGAVVMVGVGGRSKVKATPKLPDPPAVEVATVEQRNVPMYGEWIGTLAGMVNATVKAEVAGYLLRRDYKEGSFVRKGQLLFEIDFRPFKAALDQAKGRLAEAEAQLSQNKAQLAASQANQLKSQFDVNKYGPLAKAQAVSQQDLDDAVQTNLANKAQVQKAVAAIAAAKAQIEADQAAVETAAINLGFTRITSPISGIAGIAQAQVGDLVSASSGPLTKVSTLDPIQDYFSVSEQEYLELQKRLTGSDPESWRLQLILADGTIYPHEGHFYFANRAVNQNTGAIQLAGLFPNPGNVLRPGEYGKVRAIIRVRKNALVVPSAAVAQLQGGFEVDVVDEHNRVAIRQVKVGPQTGMDWVVLDGLQPGETVVVEGQQDLRPGMTVDPQTFRSSGE